MANSPIDDIQDILKQVNAAQDRLKKELQNIDKKINDGVSTAEARLPNAPFTRADLEIKQQYIEQEKLAIALQLFLAIRSISTALLQEAAKKSAADADKATADAEVAKQRADAEAAKKKADAESAAAKAKADADSAAAKAKADADGAAATAKADADAAAAKKKAEADEAAAKKKADAAEIANQAKYDAALKKADLETQQAIDASVDAAITRIKASATSLDEMRKMKEEIEKELKPPSTTTTLQ